MGISGKGFPTSNNSRLVESQNSKTPNSEESLRLHCTMSDEFCCIEPVRQPPDAPVQVEVLKTQTCQAVQVHQDLNSVQ
jgi:hypothetical protein